MESGSVGGSLPARWGGSVGVIVGIAGGIGALGGALGGGECLHCGHWVSCESHDAHHLAEQHL